MKKLNGSLVGGKGLPMKYIRAESAQGARRVWREKTGAGKTTAPVVSQVTWRKPRPRQKKGVEE